jgi:hypothetical protein
VSKSRRLYASMLSRTISTFSCDIAHAVSRQRCCILLRRRRQQQVVRRDSLRVPGAFPESLSWPARAAPVNETQHCGRQGFPGIGDPAVAIQEKRRSSWSRLVAPDQNPTETAGNQRQLASRPDQESPCNHGQIIASCSLTENRGVGGSTPPLAINPCKSTLSDLPDPPGAPRVRIMVCRVRAVAIGWPV